MESEEVAERIDAERMDAAHSEWERHERVRRVILATLDTAVKRAKRLAGGWIGEEQMVVLVGELEGIREVLAGDWLVSPKAMRAVRAPKEGETAFKRARKTAEHLGLPIEQIDEQIKTNKDLRRLFNPKAEEEVWAKKRGRGRKAEPTNPNQTDIEEQTRTAPDGRVISTPVAKEGYEFVNPDADEVLTDERLTALVNRAQEIVGAAGFATVTIWHVRAFTSSTRESLERWARAVLIAHGNGGKLPKPSKPLQKAVLNIMKDVRDG